MPTEFVAELQGTLKIDQRSRPPVAESGARQRLGGRLHGEPARPLIDHRQAHARAGDRRADRDARIVEAGADLDPSVAVQARTSRTRPRSVIMPVNIPMSQSTLCIEPAHRRRPRRLL